MTAYTTHADALFDPNKPNLGSTHLEARDNLISVAEGDPTAPRVYVAAFERITAGATEKWKHIPVLSEDSTSGFVVSFEFGIIQKGTVTVSYEHRSPSSGAQQAKVVRRRVIDGGGGAAVVETNFLEKTTTSSAFETISGDIDVQPGDALLFMQSVTASNTSEIQNLTISTGGEDLYPVSGFGYYVNLRTVT